MALPMNFPSTWSICRNLREPQRRPSLDTHAQRPRSWNQTARLMAAGGSAEAREDIPEDEDEDAFFRGDAVTANFFLIWSDGGPSGRTGRGPSGRIEAGTSASGYRRASRCSTWRLVLPVAASINARPLSSFTCLAMSRTAVGLSDPARSRSTTSGKRRATRAAATRLQAASSERRRTSMQYRVRDEKPRIAVELPGIELAEVDDEGDRRLSLPRGEGLEGGGERQVFERSCLFHLHDRLSLPSWTDQDLSPLKIDNSESGETAPIRY